MHIAIASIFMANVAVDEKPMRSCMTLRGCEAEEVEPDAEWLSIILEHSQL